MKCDDSVFLQKLGKCYKKMLLIGNKKGHNPYPEANIFPIKYFTMLYTQIVRLGMPKNLEKEIRELLDSVDAEDFAKSMEIPIPADKQIYFVNGMMFSGI